MSNPQTPQLANSKVGSSTPRSRTSTPRRRPAASDLTAATDLRRSNLSGTPRSSRPSSAISSASPGKLSPLKSPRAPPLSPQHQQKPDANAIKVVARFRPHNDLEIKKASAAQCMKITSEQTVICKDETYAFDKVFGPETSQSDVFAYSVTQTVDDLFEGYNGTVLAYGQTGSGKSYTMMGTDIEDHDLKGLIPRITDVLFDRISKADPEIEYTLSASFMEIYLEQIQDLIDPTTLNLTIVEDAVNGIHVRGLSKVYVSSAKELYNVLAKGDSTRTKASTEMNKESSRSHAIFQINLNQESPIFGVKRSKLFLVDLAGSEKIQKTGASGINLEEAKKINSSLSSLGNVINALTDPKTTHIPYRHSKLTRILQESLGGNSRTSLIVNCSPSSFNEAETVSTLRFGTRAKKIKNKAHVNKEPSSLDLLTQLEELKRINEEQSLKSKEMEYELELWRTGVYKSESNDGASHAIKTESDPPVKSTLPEYQFKIDALEKRVNTLMNILTKVPTLASENDDEYKLKFFESQKVNDELMKDITHQCDRNVELQLEVDELRSQNEKMNYHESDAEKNKALETVLDKFMTQLQELETRNHLQHKEINTVKMISETRNERITTLESMIESYKAQIELSTSAHVESSIFSLRNPFSSLTKSSRKSVNTSGEASSIDTSHNDTTTITKANAEGIITKSRIRHSMDDGSNQHKHKIIDDVASLSRDSFGDDDRDNRRLSNQNNNFTTINYSDSNFGKTSRVVSGGSFGSVDNQRVGLNLHIVKPLRGGTAMMND